MINLTLHPKKKKDSLLNPNPKPDTTTCQSSDYIFFDLKIQSTHGLRNVRFFCIRLMLMLVKRRLLSGDTS